MKLRVKIYKLDADKTQKTNSTARIDYFERKVRKSIV